MRKDNLSHRMDELHMKESASVCENKNTFTMKYTINVTHKYKKEMKNKKKVIPCQIRQDRLYFEAVFAIHS